MKNRNLIVTTLFLILTPFLANAQDDLLSLAEDNAEEQEPNKIDSFYGSRLVLGHSAKTEEQKQLVLHITHRFGAINTGAYELFGLDAANIRIGFDYGITDNINIGIGRTKATKTYDAFAKYRVIQQNDKNIPLTVTLMGSVASTTERRNADAAQYGLQSISLNDRLSYASQLLIARNFGNRFSLQLSPIYIHKNNLALYQNDNVISQNDTFALGIGTSVFITSILAINAEYYPRFNVESTNPYYDAFSIGIDLETGGHIFQIQLSNSFMIGDRAYVTETAENFWNGGIHIGFNITRTFQF